MYASQLLPVLHTFPSDVNHEICAFDTDELKATMKESPRRYRNPFLSDDENDEDNFWDAPELDRPIHLDNFTNNHEDEKFRKSLAPCDVPSEFFDKATELYSDKNVMECELPQLIVCYKDSSYHVIKDICVDEGIPREENVLIGKDNDELLSNALAANGDKHGEENEGTLDTQFAKHEGLRSSSREVSYMNTELSSGTKEKVDPNLSIPDDCGDVEHKHDEMIEGSFDTNLCREDHQTNDNLSFETKEKVDTDLPIPELINGRKDMGKVSNDAEIPIRDGQDSSKGKDCEMDATNEGDIKEKVAFDSFIRSEFNEVSKDNTDDDGISSCAPDELRLSVQSNTIQDAAHKCGPDNSMQTVEEKLNSSATLVDDNSIEHLDSNSMLPKQQDRPLKSLKFLFESSSNGINNVDQQPSQIFVEEISKRPIVGSEAEELGRSGQTTGAVNKTISSNFDLGKSSVSSGPRGTENTEPVHNLTLETLGAPNLRDLASESVATANQVERGEGESSFSVAGPPSGLITYSGPIALSGSMSLRSDSSTTSTRSFAFPILQTEWNSSPVRMATADRRHLRKHRGWRQGLLCCRF